MSTTTCICSSSFNNTSKITNLPINNNSNGSIFYHKDNNDSNNDLHRVRKCDPFIPVATSVPAMEHSTVISWGRDGEEEAYINMIQKNGHKGTISSNFRWYYFYCL